jgi:HTH-type transcriptional regulator/antitoxin HigA
MLKIIKSEAEYENALEKAYIFMNKESLKGKDADELEVLTLLIEHYEKEHYPVLPPKPVEAIKFRLEQLGKSETELSKILGARSRQSEILSGKRKLSLSMIRKLHEVLGIPAGVLIGEY